MIKANNTKKTKTKEDYIELAKELYGTMYNKAVSSPKAFGIAMLLAATLAAMLGVYFIIPETVGFAFFLLYMFRKETSAKSETEDNTEETPSVEVCSN